MDLFLLDENGRFKLKFYDDIIVELESLFSKISSLALGLNEIKAFDFEDVKKTKHTFNVKKVDINCYQLEKYSIIQEKFQEIELYEKVNLIIEDKVYHIYSKLQVNYLLEKVLKIKECTYYLLGENKEENQINLKDFKDYSGKNIIIKIDNENKFDQIFKRKKDEEKKKLINLTLNVDGIFEKQELNNEVFNGEGRKQFQQELDDLCDSNDENYKYYCGQSGIGKTVSLLDYRYRTHYNILYLNMNSLFKRINLLNEFHTALKNELTYIFRSYDQYNSFIEQYGKDIFLHSFENVDLNRLRFTIIVKLIEKLLFDFSKKGEKIMVIIDQYIKKYDYGITDKLEKYTQDNEYFKFVCCCSIDEVDVRENMHNSIFEKNREKKKFISINTLIKIDLSSLTDKQKRVFEMFGNSPKYFDKIKKTEDKDLDSLIGILKEEIYNDIGKSIKKLNIENRVIYGLLKVMYNINKEIDFIENYNKLMLLRLNQNVRVQFDIPTEIDNINIPPLLLIPLVENAYKHGISSTKDSFISCCLEIKDKYLIFKVENSVSDEDTEDRSHSGIGLQNLRKRLSIIYGNRATFEAQKTDYGTFVAQLVMPIEK